MWTGNRVTSVCNSNINPFQSMSVFYRCIKGMLHSKVADDGDMCGQTSEHPQIFPYVCNPYMLYGFLRKIRRYVYQLLRLKINPHMYGFLHPKIRV